jgi:hypothetical protein
VIGLLRFLGILNAAIWLGSIVSYTLVAAPALTSEAAMTLYGGEKLFPYFSEATRQLIAARFLNLSITCAVIALGLLYVERFYFGRGPNRVASITLIGLLAVGLVGSFWLQPKLVGLHQAQHARNATPAIQAAAAGSFRVWHGVFQALNVLLLAGAASHLWRVSHTADSPRFVSPTKFRG